MEAAVRYRGEREARGGGLVPGHDRHLPRAAEQQSKQTDTTNSALHTRRCPSHETLKGTLNNTRNETRNKTLNETLNETVVAGALCQGEQARQGRHDGRDAAGFLAELHVEVPAHRLRPTK